MKKLSIILLALCTSAPLFAQQSFTLEQAIDYGLHNHKSLDLARNERDRADYRKGDVIAGYLPQINLTGNLDDNLSLQSTIISQGGTSTRLTIGSRYNTGIVGQVDQVIYDQSMMIGIKATQPNIAYSELSYQQTEEMIIYNVAGLYYQVYVNEYYLKLLLQNKEKYERFLEIAKLQLEKGIITKIDFDRIQVSLSNTLSQISVADQNYELSKLRLKNAMGFSLNEEIIISDTTLLQNYTLDPPQLDTFNVKARTDYKLQDTKIALYRLEMKRIRATNYPRLTAYGRYGQMAIGNDFGQSFTNHFSYSSVGLKLTVPIFDGLKRSYQYKMAKVDWSNANINQELNKNNYELEYNSAQTQMIKTYNQLQDNERNLSLSQSVFEKTSMQYQKGVATMSDLLNAETAYKEAQVNYANALMSYYISKLDYEKSRGNIRSYINQ